MLHGAAVAVRLVEAHEAVDQSLARPDLHLRIERRADGEAALVEFLVAVAVRQFAAHFLGEIAGDIGIGRERARVDAERLGARLVALVL